MAEPKFESQTGNNEPVFEKQATGSFQFFEFKEDGIQFTGKFIGLIGDPKSNLYTVDYWGDPRGMAYKRDDITGIVMEAYSTTDKTVKGAIYIIGLYWQLEKYLLSQKEDNIDFRTKLYRFTRLKKNEKGFMVFDVERANI